MRNLEAANTWLKDDKHATKVALSPSHVSANWSAGSMMWNWDRLTGLR
jgi:hypothetical protein